MEWLKFRNAPNHRKALGAVLATLLLLCLGGLVWSHMEQRRGLHQEALTRLGTITSTLASTLNGDHLSHLLERYDGRGTIIKNTQDARYFVMYDHLRRGAETNGLSQPLRILAYDSLKQELQVIVTSEDAPDFRARFDAGAAPLMNKYGQAGRVDPEKQARDGHLMAFDVILDSRGHVAGTVLAMQPVAELRHEMEGALMRNMAIAFGFFLLAAIVIHGSAGRWLARDEHAHRKLREHHEGITDSIAYAGKIQRALVPDPQVYGELFKDHFVLDRPKDMVSGDFHWYHRVGPEQCYVAAADCTGHGLPGAMMAAIGCSLLNEIVSQRPNADPGDILAQLSERLVSTLHQQGGLPGRGDGMDMALCRLDLRRSELLFAGAFRPLYWLHEGQLSVINGDRQPLGGSQHDAHRRFTTHRIAYNTGARFYMFSDGYVDQFGGPDRRKFMAQRLDRLLLEHQHMPLSEQGALLERTFMEWKGDQEQLDDVCFLGLEV